MSDIPATPSDVTPSEAYTPIQKVLRYYPQRVQVLVLAAFNFGLAVLAEVGVELSVALTGAGNALLLAVLVFFYGEQRTASKQAIADWFEAEPSTPPKGP